MGLLNPSFEDAGALPGEAEHWTLQTFTSLQRVAGFGPVAHEAWETFERWFDLLVDLSDVAVALFDPLAEGFEDFDDAWDNDLYLTELPTGQLVTAPFGGGAVEDLEEGWDNAPFAWAWDEVASETGLFDVEPHEDFDERWHGNESFAWTWASVTALTARFDGGPDTDEDYENDWPSATTI